MSKSFNARIKSKHDVEANWKKATNFIPYEGEIIIYDSDNTHTASRFKVGNGSTKINDLPFVSAETIATLGNSSFGSGWGESLLNKTYIVSDVPLLGDVTIGPLTNLDGLKTNEAVATNATSIDFKIGS